jgi:signal-transduction protein with cAMP-binding, CBS, and nucleotidyltransferase domain
MAIFPGAKGGDILAWRGISRLVVELRAKSAEKMSGLLHDESISFLKGLDERLEAEIAFEEEFSVEFAKVLAALELARFEDEFAPLLHHFEQLAERHFRKRGSVVAYHALCNTYRDAMVRKALPWVEEWLAQEGQGRPPAPYCFLAAGSIGRLEQTFCVDPSYFLVHGDLPADRAGYFATFLYRVRAFLENIGLVKNGGRVAAEQALWHGSRTDWRREFVEAGVQEERGRLFELAQRADLRLICGDASLAEEMINLVRSMLEFRQVELRENTKSVARESLVGAALSFPLPGLRGMGKRVADMPTGLDFFGRLRLGKSGRHRGEFDLCQYALAPLITNVRVLAINGALHETSTIARIKALQERGQFSVDLTEKLLFAYHDFTRLKINRQLAGGCDREIACFIARQELTEDEEFRLRTGLEAVADLEKIVYLRFAEQG